MNVQQALKEITNDPLKPVYLILGTEGYLQQVIRNAFFTRMKRDNLEELNFMNFDSSEGNLASVVAEAESLPFFGDYRLVFVENPSFLTGEKKIADQEAAIEEMITYLKRPLESTVLVFWANYEKLDARKKITKALKKAAETIEVAPLAEAPLKSYVQQYLKKENVTISAEAFDLLLRLTDFDLSKIMNELEKLILAADPSIGITIAEVRNLVPKTLEHNVFEITEELLKGNSGKTIQIYQDLLLQGEETIRLNAILISQIRLLLQTKILMKIGYQQANIAETLSVHPYRVKMAMQQVKGISEKLLIDLFDQLVENDFLVKSGQADKELSFQLFVLKTAEKIKLAK